MSRQARFDVPGSLHHARDVSRSRRKRRGASAGWAKEEGVGGKGQYRLSTEMGLSLAEIARKLGVATSGIAMAVRREERRGESDESEQRPLDPVQS